MHKKMLNKPTYAIVTMVAMEALWSLREKWLLCDTKFSKLIFLKCFVFFSVRAVILKA